VYIYRMKRLFFLGLLGLMACEESAPTDETIADTLAAKSAVEPEIKPEDRRTVGGQNLAPILDTFFWAAKINDEFVYEEPCDLVVEALTISKSDGGELPGYYINLGTSSQNYNYYVLEATKSDAAIIVKLIDSNNLEFEGEPIETWAFEIVEDYVIWRKMDAASDQYLLPIARKVSTTIDPCIDFELLSRNFPERWVDFVINENTGEQYIFNCRCKPESASFSTGEDGTPYYSRSEGCDSDSYEITKIEKANNIVTIWYNRMDYEVKVTIEYSDWGEGILEFTYGNSNSGLTRMYRRVRESEVSLYEQRYCDEDEEF
jgi:hypothetical protein